MQVTSWLHNNVRLAATTLSKVIQTGSRRDSALLQDCQLSWNDERAANVTGDGSYRQGVPVARESTDTAIRVRVAHDEVLPATASTHLA